VGIRWGMDEWWNGNVGAEARKSIDLVGPLFPVFSVHIARSLVAVDRLCKLPPGQFVMFGLILASVVRSCS
jgi:hypothetical protein